MKIARRVLGFSCVPVLAIGIVWACGFDDSMREYLSGHFWLPFAKGHEHFEKRSVQRISAPYAGMTAADNNSRLARLREAYQRISQPQSAAFDITPLQQAVTIARADSSLTRREKEEVELIDAKIDMRSWQPGEPQLLESAKKKLQAFLQTARTPELLSEARGWLARVHYLMGDQTAAGKIYLDELNRDGSNLSRETVLNSLWMTYGYDGGGVLLEHLEEYFDTPEHAAFAIQLVTNPRWDRSARQFERDDGAAQSYARIRSLIEKHRNLMESNTGANTLALLAMRTALRAGDPPAARLAADAVPTNAAVRSEPDFNWMLASALFLSQDFAAAERPLLALFRSSRSSANQKAAAAYGLCGVYRKTGNIAEQLRFALWLHTTVRTNRMYLDHASGIADLTVYWAVSGWDLNMLLDTEAPINALQSFVNENPDLKNVGLVKYSLAVRLTRENRYEEAARLYESINAVRRAARARRLTALYEEANRTDLADPERQEARYRLAEFIGANPNGIYFNDALWNGLQRYALKASSGDTRLTSAERQAAIENERQLRDDQEERWRAYLILRELVQEGGETDLGRKAAVLAAQYLRGISDRFGRQAEIRKALIELSARRRR